MLHPQYTNIQISIQYKCITITLQYSYITVQLQLQYNCNEIAIQLQYSYITIHLRFHYNYLKYTYNCPTMVPIFLQWSWPLVRHSTDEAVLGLCRNSLHHPHHRLLFRQRLLSRLCVLVANDSRQRHHNDCPRWISLHADWTASHSAQRRLQSRLVGKIVNNSQSCSIDFLLIDFLLIGSSWVYLLLIWVVGWWCWSWTVRYSEASFLSIVWDQYGVWRKWFCLVHRTLLVKLPLGTVRSTRLQRGWLWQSILYRNCLWQNC